LIGHGEGGEIATRVAIDNPDKVKNLLLIVPDLCGLGDSSKPVTGNDGNTTELPQSKNSMMRMIS
jgi:pimeloyl-ACP methyl ester carboxylesterase